MGRGLKGYFHDRRKIVALRNNLALWQVSGNSLQNFLLSLSVLVSSCTGKLLEVFSLSLIAVSSLAAFWHFCSYRLFKEAVVVQ